MIAPAKGLPCIVDLFQFPHDIILQKGSCLEEKPVAGLKKVLDSIPGILS